MVYVVIILFILFALGIGSNVILGIRCYKHIVYAHNYFQSLEAFFEQYNTGHFNSDLFEWLKSHSNKMQKILSYQGKIELHPKKESYIIRNYRVIHDLLPDIEEKNVDPAAITEAKRALVERMEYLENMHRKHQKHIINPLFWIVDGVQLIISPFVLLGWFIKMSIKRRKT